MTERRAKMTVCIPVHNAMPYLPDTIESILGQSFTDFDVLVIDDGSSDGSWPYLETIEDTRVTILRQPNAGLTATLNRMLEILGSGWMIRQDADDIALPNRLQRIRDYSLRFPEAGMIYSQAAHFQDGGLKHRLLTTQTDQTGLRSFLQKGYLPSICHPSIALRVDAALEVGGYRFDLHVEDYDLYWRLGLRFDVHAIPEVLLGYRMTKSSVCDTHAKSQATNVLFIQYLLLTELWKRKSSTYLEVLPVLKQMVDTRHLNCRKYMRSAMSCLGEGQYGGFIWLVLRAFLAAPDCFIRRITKDEIDLARVGVAPEVFWSRASLLWRSARKLG